MRHASYATQVGYYLQQQQQQQQPQPQPPVRSCRNYSFLSPLLISSSTNTHHLYIFLGARGPIHNNFSFSSSNMHLKNNKKWARGKNKLRARTNGMPVAPAVSPVRRPAHHAFGLSRRARGAQRTHVSPAGSRAAATTTTSAAAAAAASGSPDCDGPRLHHDREAVAAPGMGRREKN